MKTKLKDNEFSFLTLAISGAIERRFIDCKIFNAYLTELQAKYDPCTGFEILTLRVIVTRK